MALLQGVSLERRLAASIHLRWEYHWANQYSSESLNALAERKRSDSR